MRAARARITLLLAAVSLPGAAAEHDLAAARIAAAARLQSIEADADKAATQLDDLSRQRADLQAQLAARAAAIAPLLPLAERMRLDPAEALLAGEVPPEAALHGLLVLRGLARRLEREAEALRSKQGEVERLSREIAAVAPRLRAAQAAQEVQAAALDQALAKARERRARRDAADSAAQAAQREAEQAAQRAAEAATVSGALDRLAVARHREPARTQAARQEAKAAPPTGLATPVAGRVVRGWGDPTDAGPAQGLTFRAAPQARVVSPCAGRVAFAGPFRSFGLLLILDCGRSYNVVMAGFDRLDAQVGRRVQEGEPVGVMPPWNPQAPGSRPGLYVELRRNGQRVNPSPLLNVRG
jgi:septal ring factor EnvC (AmiA/AmiB activator)